MKGHQEWRERGGGGESVGSGQKEITALSLFELSCE